jgi:hypothetical protein
LSPPYVAISVARRLALTQSGAIAALSRAGLFLFGMPQRHRSDATLLSAFHDEVLVTCPHCAKCALVGLHTLESPAKAGPFRANQRARFTCAHCGRNAQRSAFLRWNNGACDPVFRLPVWLRARCRHGTFWAYNLRHLDQIEAFVGASLRERQRDPVRGWSNRAWTSRLPAWISSTKNREEVLRCIARIRRERTA